MKRCLIVLTVCVLALVTWVQVAAAGTPSTGVQTADQSALERPGCPRRIRCSTNSAEQHQRLDPGPQPR